MRRRLTYANVTATVALVVALTGTGSYAASKLAPRSVGEPQLRPGAITASKIRKNAVTATKIKALAVKQGKLANQAVTAAKLAAGSVAASSLQDDAVTNSKIASEAVTGDKVNEKTLSQVPSAARADRAGFAESANPAAFARVTKEASIDQTLSKGISVVAEGSLAGTYCVTASDFNPRGAQVTPQFNVSGNITAYAVVGGTVDCPAPAVEVQTFDGGARTRAPFYVVLYG